jgi:glutathione S-transferase
MVLKLYSFEQSGNGKRVALILHEKGIPFEFHVVDPFKGEHKAPQFLEKQPFGSVPYLVCAPFFLEDV